MFNIRIALVLGYVLLVGVGLCYMVDVIQAIVR
jgi:hypothetical protein